MAYGNILQIIPPQPGWEAVYAEIYYKGKGASFTKIPLNCWAVVEAKVEKNNSGYGTVVVGMLVTVTNSSVLDFADSMEGFLGYNYPGCDLNWHLEAEKHRKMRRNRE